MGPILGFMVVPSLTQYDWLWLQYIQVTGSSHLGWESMLYLSDAAPALRAISVNDGFVDTAMLLNMGTCWPQIRYITIKYSGLDAIAVATIQQANWQHLTHVCLDFNVVGAAASSVLHTLSLCHTGIDGPAVQYLAQGQCPQLWALHLEGNDIGLTGVSHLVQGSWPVLDILTLSSQGLDEEAYGVLGALEACRYTVDVAELQQFGILDMTGVESEQLLFSCTSTLPQFPNLIIHVTKD